MKTSTALTSFIIVAAIIVLTNILSENFFLRFDFTQDNRYTLSQATKDILNEIDETVTITAYFSDDLPPQVERYKTDFQDLLLEYRSKSNKNVEFVFVDPTTDKKYEQEAIENGVQPFLLDVRDENKVKQQKTFMGALIQCGDQKEVVPAIHAVTSMEYAISSAIKKIASKDKISIGLLQGHGEPSPMAVQQAMAALMIMYNVEQVELTDSSTNLQNYKTIAIIAPTDTIPDSHLAQLDNFLANGGNLFIALNRVDGKLQAQPPTGTEVSTQLEMWLAKKGLVVDNNFVIDASCASIQVQQMQGEFRMISQVQFPYLPVITNFAEHPVCEGLEAMILQFASTLRYNGSKQNTFTPIVSTSEKSGTQPTPLFFDIERDWLEEDFPLNKLTVAGILEGKLVGDANSKLIVITDGDFVVNGEGQEAQAQQVDNINFMINSIDWLSDDTGLIELRTKGITARPLKEIENSTKTMLKYLNFVLPIVLVIVIGLFRFQLNKMKRLRRMVENQL